jgi:hypothetical protein
VPVFFDDRKKSYDVPEDKTVYSIPIRGEEAFFEALVE